MLKIGGDKLSYIKIVTPRQPLGQTGKSKLTIDKDGKVTMGGKPIPGRTLRAGIDSDDIARHKYLLERQHFGHR